METITEACRLIVMTTAAGLSACISVAFMMAISKTWKKFFDK